MVQIKKIESAGASPFPLEGHTIFFYTDMRSGKRNLYIYGGMGKYSNLEDLYQLNCTYSVNDWIFWFFWFFDYIILFTNYVAFYISANKRMETNNNVRPKASRYV